MTPIRKLTVALLAVAVLAPPAGAQTWRSLGPFGGRMTSLAVDPFSPDVVLAGTASGGLYRSANRGVSWSLIDDLSEAAGISGIVFDPRTLGTVYAAAFRLGVLKSVDHGMTWRPSSAGLPGLSGGDVRVHALAIDPGRPSTLYLALSQGPGLFKSADGGASWAPIGGGIQAVEAIAVDPAGAVYAGTRSSGLFKSLDGGATWRRSGLARFAPVTAIAIAPSSPSTLYAGTEREGLFRSANGGATWRRIGRALPDSSIAALAVHPDDPDTLYAGLPDLEGRPGAAGGLFKSVDAGRTWSPADGGLPDEGVLALAIDPDRPSRIFAGLSASGVFRSGSAGRRWTPVSAGISGLAVVRLEASPSRPGTVYAGPTDRGLFKTRDGGRSWNLVNRRLRGAVEVGLALDPASPDTVYAGAGGILERSDDGGGSWRRIDAGLRQAIFLGPIASGPRPAAILYAGTVEGVFRSADRGESWLAPAAGFGCLVTVEITVSPAAPAEVYASALSLTGGCGEVGGAFKSADGGVAWTRISVGEPVGTLRPHPVDPAVVYALGAAGVLRSDDGGLHFAPAGQPPLQEPARLGDLAVDPFHPDAIYLATNGQGVFVSDDGGAFWEPLGEGLDGIEIYVLEADPAVPGRIWAGTSRGVFVLDRAPAP